MDDKCPDCGMEFEMVVEGKIPGDLRERQDHPGGVRCLSRQLAAYRAIEDHLPDLCGMGDDMTVAFALQLSALEARLADAKAERDALQAIVDRLRDDALALRVGEKCNDPNHDDRWCATCESRKDGIETYRAALRTEAVQEGEAP